MSDIRKQYDTFVERYKRLPSTDFRDGLRAEIDELIDTYEVEYGKKVYYQRDWRLWMWVWLAMVVWAVLVYGFFWWAGRQYSNMPELPPHFWSNEKHVGDGLYEMNIPDKRAAWMGEWWYDDLEKSLQQAIAETEQEKKTMEESIDAVENERSDLVESVPFRFPSEFARQVEMGKR